jgi:predicted N-formylglutamate amidohydrolase
MFEPYQAHNLEGDKRFLVICDHASNVIPADLGTLGLSPEQLEQHIAYDLGAADIARGVAARLNCPAILSGFSRLVIDPNRGLDDPTLVMKLSDGEIIQGNADIDIYRNKKGFQERIDRFYQPYHDAIAAALDRAIAAAISPIILSVHSFTPVWKGEDRPWHGAILWDRDDRLRNHMLRYFSDRPEIVFGDNEPYSGRLKNDCLYRHATSRGLAHGLIEIRQDLATATASQSAWIGYMADILTAAVSDAKVTSVTYFGSATD